MAEGEGEGVIVSSTGTVVGGRGGFVVGFSGGGGGGGGGGGPLPPHSEDFGLGLDKPEPNSITGPGFGNTTCCCSIDDKDSYSPHLREDVWQ